MSSEPEVPKEEESEGASACSPDQRTPKDTEFYLFSWSVTIGLRCEDCKVHQATLVTSALGIVVSHIFFSYKRWWPLRSIILATLRSHLTPSPNHWSVKNGINTYTGNTKIHGRFMDLNLKLDNPPALFNNQIYNGCLGETDMSLKYTVTAFLSSVTPNGENQDISIFNKHLFFRRKPPPVRYVAHQNVFRILETFEEQGRTEFNHDAAWQIVKNELSAAKSSENTK